MDLTGKVALITGGAHRVGRTISLALAAAGAHVVVNYHTSAAAAAETVKAAQATGVEASAIQADVSQPAAVTHLADQIQAQFGGVDVIVNSAGLFLPTRFPTEDWETWRQVTATSIDGPVLVCNALASGLLARGGGAIINIVDLSVWQPWRNFTAHAVGKAGLLALTRQLAVELAPTVRVNAVAPGLVLPPPHFSDELIQRYADRTLLGRWGSPDDVARTVLFLLQADFITGEVITVDGGERLKWHPA